MFCTNCGAENPDNTNFCTNCGAKLGAPDPNAGINPNLVQNTGFTPQNDQPMGFDPTNPGNQQGGFGYQTGSDNFGGYQSGQDGYTGYQQPQSNPYYGAPMNTGIGGRSIILAILLSFVTCGIYMIYWFIVLTDETNQLSGRQNETSGVLACILTIITCGIYGWYWAYKLGEKTDIIKNDPNGSSNVLFIILQIFGFGIVNYALAQDAINKAVGYQG